MEIGEHLMVGLSYKIASSNSIIFAENTFMHVTLREFDKFGWDVHVDANSDRILHFTFRGTYGVTYVTATFASESYTFESLAVWRKADTYGNGRVWIPKVEAWYLKFSEVLEFLHQHSEALEQERQRFEDEREEDAARENEKRGWRPAWTKTATPTDNTDTRQGHVHKVKTEEE